MRKVLLLFLLLLPTAIFAQTGIYMDGQTGWAAQSDLPTAANVGATSTSNDNFVSTVWAGDVGYNHDFAHYIGAGFEVGGGIFGKETYNFSNGSSSVTSSILSFLIEVTPHVNAFDVILKAGIGKPFAQITGLNANSSARSNQCEFESQIGLGYRIIPHLAVTSVYMHLTGGQTNSLAQPVSPSINAVLVGLRVIF